ncbi:MULTISPECIES: hydantoinase/oxoprolinase family protein [unclassified Rathayibacter]|uniref:hydantoinase/oxoprolinase family protein n=1 Tax=unclassified Rathayibacter TaxID=2609250 RepID=UPI0006FAF806|nr:MULTISPECIES: hydantoinase/oxoprolinase family protein [unclassified Rathayibacter]KQQ05758.1 methylhydantoinase [Rathayibacter sp. Leaf294]KQS13616.1 methylhydantoinase [Rathayibacter sp. Leaf185]
MTERPYRLAVDIGGTFVDAMELDQRTGAVRFRKAPTTPAEPWKGVLAALEALGTDLAEAELFIHGTTLGLNAVLERRGSATGIITNAGLRDIFLLGRGNVPDDRMYDFQYQRPPSLVQRRHTAGVVGRLDHRGEVVTPLDEDDLRSIARHLVEDEGVVSIAICFVHSYLNPESERRAAELLREWHPDLKVSVSTDIVQEYREYERTSTTVLEAYIRPIFERYVDELERGLAARGFDARFLIMRSGGGSMTSASAKASPTPTVLSGPAGGIVGASHLAEVLGRQNMLTFDIGGTSLDACVIEGGTAVVTHEAELEHFPLLIPTYDIRTIGAGGGSIAAVERGLLQVGPRSASAVPGPVAYGRGGTEPTVTDASVVLGYVDPESFLSGTMRLHEAEAREAVRERIAAPLGLSVEEAAAGIFDVMLAKTVGAVRQITVERGHDPRTFSLLAFGGAGPLVAPLLAREMGVGEVVVPFAPSGFSAWGMLSADVVTDHSRTRMEVLEDADLVGLAADLAEVGEAALASLEEQGVARSVAVLEQQLELRYLGQEHTLAVTVGDDLDAPAIRAAFDAQHRAQYGHAMENKVQILTTRVRGIGRTARPELSTSAIGDGDPSRALVRHRTAYDFGSRAMTGFAVYDRSLLEPGDAFLGPALVDEGTSTTVVHSGQQVRVEEHGYLLITPATPTPTEA